MKAQKEVKVYGSKKLSYTVKLNRDQCAYRLYLMGQDDVRGRSELFPPMIRGLLLHRLAEAIVKGEAYTFDGLVEAITKPSRPDVDWGERVIVWGDADPDQFWNKLEREAQRFEKAFIHFLQTHIASQYKVYAEWEASSVFQTPIVGHFDLMFEAADGTRIVADLKTGKYDLKSEQFLLYSWLANGFKEAEVPFWVLHWDGEDLVRYVVKHHLSEKDPRLMALLWTLEAIGWELREAENRISRGKHPALVLKPNTGHYTCHPQRCSFWSVCPYGAKRQEVQR